MFRLASGSWGMQFASGAASQTDLVVHHSAIISECIAATFTPRHRQSLSSVHTRTSTYRGFRRRRSREVRRALWHDRIKILYAPRLKCRLQRRQAGGQRQRSHRRDRQRGAWRAPRLHLSEH